MSCKKNVPKQTSETSETEIIKYTSIVRLYAFIYIVNNAFDVNIIHSHLKTLKKNLDIYRIFIEN